MIGIEIATIDELREVRAGIVEVLDFEVALLKEADEKVKGWQAKKNRHAKIARMFDIRLDLIDRAIDNKNAAEKEGKTG